MSELLTRTPRPVRTRARAPDPQAPLAGQVLPSISLSSAAAHRPPGRRPATPRNGLAAAWVRAGQADQLLRIGPHLAVLTIVLLVVSFGHIQPPSSLERASNQPLDQPLLTAADSPAESLALPEYQVREVESGSQSSGEMRAYIVQQGDTISAIAARHYMEMWPLLWTNELEADQTIRPGDTLHIPPVPGAGRTVKEGDTLESLAKKFDVDPAVIVESPGNEATTRRQARRRIRIYSCRAADSPSRNSPPDTPPGCSAGRRGAGFQLISRSGIPALTSLPTMGYRSTPPTGAWCGGPSGTVNYGNQVVIDHRNGICDDLQPSVALLLRSGAARGKGDV